MNDNPAVIRIHSESHRFSLLSASAFLLVVALLWVVPSVGYADDQKQVEELAGVIKQGRAKAQGCTRCHGRQGMQQLATKAGWENSISTFVIQQLLLFRGKRQIHEVMNAVAAPMSNVDIYEVALWYESVSGNRK